MKRSNSTLKALRAFLPVAFMLLFALTSCKQTGGGGNNPTPTPPAPPLEEKAILTLEEGKNTIKIKVKTADDSAITVEGCTVATLESELEATLTATGSKVVLKGRITELECKGEYKKEQALTALDVQGYPLHRRDRQN